MKLAHTLNGALSRLGLQRIETSTPDFEPAVNATIAAVRPYTMTSPERINATCEAARYVVRNQLPGAIVECGVWAGGSMMAIARTLMENGDTSRDLYLFDTFEGMSPPTDKDVTFRGDDAASLMASEEKETGPNWAYASLQDVTANMRRTGYPMERVHFVRGPVEETIPERAPAEIALLRLDTDWYESTQHELAHLPQRVCPNGVLIIDDYGHWDGARRAVDEWVEQWDRPVLLSRTDYTGRMAILPGPTAG